VWGKHYRMPVRQATEGYRGMDGCAAETAEHRVARTTITAFSLGNRNAVYDNEWSVSSNTGAAAQASAGLSHSTAFRRGVGWLDGTSLGMGMHDCEYRAWKRQLVV
jgi:hypothetical protein